ncbi:MAG: hypothetical protein GXZ04_08010 [Clostridiales bacterium]|nr:hypothetical protein [Clostridiales bacterium]
MINNKRILLLAVVLSLLALAAQAGAVPPGELAYAYLNTQSGYLIAGQEVRFEVVLPEDIGHYTYEFTAYYAQDRAADNQFTGVDQLKAQPEPAYAFIPEQPGQYFLEVVIMDADYRSLTLQSEPFYCYEPGSEDDPNTLPGKVVQIARQAEAQGFATQYETALYLHDWLTHNADYDEPMTIHTPEGVLLWGKGVCESYALAYQMLLRQVGIKSQYVTGYSRGQLHAWNLVHLDGEWTFIDPTWNDPVGGGNEGYDYFGMTGSQLARDHDWSYGKQKPPAATASTHNYLINNGWQPFSSLEGMQELLARELTAKNPHIKYTYTGEDRYMDVQYEIKKWLDNNAHIYFAESYSYGGSSYSGTLDVSYGDYADYTFFTDDESFKAAIDGLLKAKTAQIKMYYQGTDRYFDFGITLRRFLTEHAEAYDISSYSYTYYPFHGVAEIAYK